MNIQLIKFDELYKKLAIQSPKQKQNVFLNEMNWSPWHVITVLKVNDSLYFNITTEFMILIYNIIDEYNHKIDKTKFWHLQSNLVGLINFMFKNTEYTFINEYKYTLIELSNNIRNSDLFHDIFKFQIFVNTEYDTELMYTLKHNLVYRTKYILNVNEFLDKQYNYNMKSINYNHCDIHSNYPLVYALYYSFPKDIIYTIISQTNVELLRCNTITAFELPLLHLFLYYSKNNKCDDNYIIYVIELIFYYSKYNLIEYYDMYSNNALSLAVLLNHSDEVICELIQLQQCYNDTVDIIDILKDKNDFGESCISMLVQYEREYLLKKFN